MGERNYLRPLGVTVLIFVVFIGGLITAGALCIRADNRRIQAAFSACPYNRGDTVRVKLTEAKAIVLDVYWSHRDGVRIRIRSACHYGAGETWSIRSEGLGGSAGGSERWLEVSEWEIERWEARR